MCGYKIVKPFRLEPKYLTVQRSLSKKRVRELKGDLRKTRRSSDENFAANFLNQIIGCLIQTRMKRANPVNRSHSNNISLLTS